MIVPEKVKIKVVPRFFQYLGSGGIFSTSKKSGNKFTHCNNYVTCREVFANQFKRNTNYIIYSKTRLNINKINDFFEQIENKLKINPKTIFHPSEFETSVVIELSPFWKENALRRGMFTLFLRCAGNYYDGKDIYKSLLKYSLTRQIIGCIEWFMKGNTVLKSNISSSQVVHNLSSFSRNDWESNLVKR